MLAGRYAVFADVDETLIRHKSMIVFLEYLLEQTSFATSGAAARTRRQFAAIKADHSPSADRLALNRRYYEMFRGLPRAVLQQAACAWVDDAMSGDDFFIPQIYDELTQHKQLGADLVLVSGSFQEVLAPIATKLGADQLLCTELEVMAGTYTGIVLQQVIGDGKWDVIQRYLETRAPLDLATCYGYGDHVSDVCFMEKVGHAVVVGNSPPMLAIAEQRHWRVVRV
jgi:HAD superfamily hydrolase (TIGR01490 family)